MLGEGVHARISIVLKALAIPWIFGASLRAKRQWGFQEFGEIPALCLNMPIGVSSNDSYAPGTSGHRSGPSGHRRGPGNIMVSGNLQKSLGGALAILWPWPGALVFCFPASQLWPEIWFRSVLYKKRTGTRSLAIPLSPKSLGIKGCPRPAEPRAAVISYAWECM